MCVTRGDIVALGDDRPARGRILPQGHGILIGAAVLLFLSALSQPINHDESQYVGAVAWMRSGLPFADFAYLQTPLQPLILAPLSLLPAGWLLVAIRLFNAAAVFVAMSAVLIGVRDRVPHWAAAAGAIALVSADAVLRCGLVARNDALPLALLAGAIAVLLPSASGGMSKSRAATAFLLLGLAVSGKISMALPAAGAGLFLLLRARSFRWGVILAALFGGLLGLAPSLILYALDPASFRFGVFTYNLQAPQQWWAEVGEGLRLEPAQKLQKLASLSLKGAFALGLVVTIIDRRRSPERLLLDLMILGGIVAAYIPDPTFAQYLVPLAAPLSARLAFALASFSNTQRRLTLLALAIFALVGMSRTAKAISNSVMNGSELAAAVRHARIISFAAQGGQVVTLSSERASGSDIALHRGFVNGPFLFRTRGPLAADALRLGYSPNWERIQALDRSPPAVIFTGAERKTYLPFHPKGLDGHLDEWARSRAYVPERLDDGFVVWRAPRKRQSREDRHK